MYRKWEVDDRKEICAIGFPKQNWQTAVPAGVHFPAAASYCIYQWLTECFSLYHSKWLKKKDKKYNFHGLINVIGTCD